MLIGSNVFFDKSEKKSFTIIRRELPTFHGKLYRNLFIIAAWLTSFEENRTPYTPFTGKGSSIHKIVFALN